MIRDRVARLRQWAGEQSASLYVVASVLGLFALSDPGDRVGFATGAVVTALAALVAVRAEQ